MSAQASPAKSQAAWAQIEREAQASGAVVPGPLAGIRVLDLSAVISGPMAVGLLADQGATVIKVEPHSGDLTRIVGPAKGDISAAFAHVNRGKLSLALDLKTPEGLAIVRELAAAADVLVENFRPGVMQRLGLGYEALKAGNPGLVYLSITGFGPDGPNAHLRVYDTVIQAAAGWAAAHPNAQTGEPQLINTLVCDKVTALTAAQAVTAALLQRARGPQGQGQHIELAMLDASIAFLWPEACFNQAFLDEPPPKAPEYGTGVKLWKTSDGYIAIITPQNDEFAALVRTLGLPELVQDPQFLNIVVRRQNTAALRGLLEPVFLQRSTEHWVQALGHAGVPVGAANTKDGLAQDPQVRHNASLQEAHYPDLGRVRSPRLAARFHGAVMPTAAAAGRLAPHVGQHSAAVLKALGHSAQQVQALVNKGAVKG